MNKQWAHNWMVNGVRRYLCVQMPLKYYFELKLASIANPCSVSRTSADESACCVSSSFSQPLAAPDVWDPRDRWAIRLPRSQSTKTPQKCSLFSVSIGEYISTSRWAISQDTLLSTTYISMWLLLSKYIQKKHSSRNRWSTENRDHQLKRGFWTSWGSSRQPKSFSSAQIPGNVNGRQPTQAPRGSPACYPILSVYPSPFPW